MSIMELNYQQVEVNVPDQAQDSELTVYLALKNISNYPTDISIKRKQICECKQVMKPSGLTFTKKIFECPHRELVTISPMEQELDVSRKILNYLIKIAYAENPPVAHKQARTGT